MNNQEKMAVLKMLEEGKITADEALNLIEAINANSIDNFIGDNAERLKVVFEEVKVRAADLAKKMEPHIYDAKEKIGETYKKLEPTIMDVSKKVKKVANDAVDQINRKIQK